MNRKKCRIRRAKYIHSFRHPLTVLDHIPAGNRAAVLTLECGEAALGRDGPRGMEGISVLGMSY